jgi:hypothetical protein
MDEHQALLKFLPCCARDIGAGEDPVIWKQATAADPKLGVSFRGAYTVNELDTRPDPA